MSHIIKKSLVTEKSSFLAEKGIYVFKVSRAADKNEIKDHIEKYFKVKVKAVRTSICRNRPKKTRFGKGRVQYWKKAFIRLKEGEKISAFEGN